MDTFFSLVSVFLIKGFHCIHGSFANVKFPNCLRGVCVCVIPGLRTPVWAIGPSSMILLTRTWPAADFMVQPIPLTGSFMSVTRLSPESTEEVWE